jgi:pilus assembly protein TadC
VGALLPWVLGASWGVLVALPVVARARRLVIAGRMPGPSSTRGSPLRVRSIAVFGRASARLAAIGGPVVRVLADLRARRAKRSAERQVARELPIVLDLLGVAVDAGCTPYLAVETAAHWSPPVIAHEFGSVLRACALGVGFHTALGQLAGRAPQLRPLADALLATERLGAPVGPMLARLAAEERTALRLRAEAHARRVPIRLLFPLVFLVLPAFVLLTVVPGLASGLSQL